MHRVHMAPLQSMGGGKEIGTEAKWVSEKGSFYPSRNGALPRHAVWKETIGAHYWETLDMRGR